MSGLIKPVTQRGRTGATRRARNPATSYDTNPSDRVAQILCGSKNNDSSLFISSYHEDKKEKRKEQMRERMKKWLAVGALLFVIFLAKRPITTSTYTHNPIKSTGVIANNDQKSIVLGDTTKICGRKIPVDLGNQKNWPTPFTPSLGAKIDRDTKEVTLQKQDGIFGNLGAAFNSFFHVYDYAADHKRPIYITQDAWIFDAFSPLFFGPWNAVQKNDKLWGTVQDTLGVRIIENEGVLTLSGLKDPEYLNTHLSFYTASKDPDTTKIRNHRNTVLRTLFSYPSINAPSGSPGNVCNNVDSVVGDDKGKKYTVIHVAQAGVKHYLEKLQGFTGKDHTGASEMTPDYVKNILKQADMLQHPIYPLDASGSDVDYKVHDALSKDAELAKVLKEVNFDLGANLYLAVLADVYLGNPVDQLSLWIARMRYALGIKNTFIFTEKKGDGWVSYLDDDNYLQLYDVKFLGTPWMG